MTGLDPSTIAGAIRSGPGTMPVFPPSVLDDQELASIVKYVRFMQDPPHPGGTTLGYYGPVAEGMVAFGVLALLALIGRWIEKRGRG